MQASITNAAAVMRESQKEFLSVLGYFYLQSGKYEKSLILYKALEAFFPDDEHFTKSLSYLYLLTGDYEKALEYADKYLQHDIEKSAKALGCFLKAKALWSLGKKEAALGVLKNFLTAEEIR